MLPVLQPLKCMSIHLATFHVIRIGDPNKPLVGIMLCVQPLKLVSSFFVFRYEYFPNDISFNWATFAPSKD